MNHPGYHRRREAADWDRRIQQVIAEKLAADRARARQASLDLARSAKQIDTFPLAPLNPPLFSQRCKHRNKI
jgi:hypothetical protein